MRDPLELAPYESAGKGLDRGQSRRYLSVNAVNGFFELFLIARQRPKFIEHDFLHALHLVGDFGHQLLELQFHRKITRSLRALKSEFKITKLRSSKGSMRPQWRIGIESSELNCILQKNRAKPVKYFQVRLRSEILSTF